MLSLVGGVVAVAVGLVGLFLKYYGQAGWKYFLKGLAASLPVMLIVGGIIAFVAGIGSLKDRAASAREEAEVAKKEAKKEAKEEKK